MMPKVRVAREEDTREGGEYGRSIESPTTRNRLSSLQRQRSADPGSPYRGLSETATSSPRSDMRVSKKKRRVGGKWWALRGWGPLRTWRVATAWSWFRLRYPRLAAAFLGFLALLLLWVFARQMEKWHWLYMVRNPRNSGYNFEFMNENLKALPLPYPPPSRHAKPTPPSPKSSLSYSSMSSSSRYGKDLAEVVSLPPAVLKEIVLFPPGNLRPAKNGTHVKLTQLPSDVRKCKIVLLAPRCCDFPTTPEDANKELECHAAMLSLCTPLGPSTCYHKAAASQACQAFTQPQGHKLSYMSAIRRALPELQKLGWTDVKAVRLPPAYDIFYTPADEREVKKSTYDGYSSYGYKEPKGLSATQCKRSPEDIEVVEQDLAGADVIFLESSSLWHVFLKYPDKRFVVLETGDAALVRQSLSYGNLQGDDLRVLGILKPSVLTPASLQNGPIFEHTSHLAFLKGAKSQKEYIQLRDPPASPELLAKVRALLPHSFRFRHPFDCGGNPEYARYLGFFGKNRTQWAPKPLAERNFDIGFLGKLDGGVYMSSKYEPLADHRWRASRQLSLLREQQNGAVAVYPSSRSFRDYSSYLETLQSLKVVVSPYSGGEWSRADYEAMMSGCLVMKPRAGAFQVYPASLFVPGETVWSVHQDFVDLANQTMAILQDLPRAQAMVERAAAILLKDDLPSFAAALDDFLGTQLAKAQRPDGRSPEEGAPGLGGLHEGDKSST